MKEAGPYDDIPESTVQTLELYRDEGIPGGHFVTAVLENDLANAFARADEDNTRALAYIVKWINHEMPACAWGDPEAVRDWIKEGGTRRKIQWN